MHRLKNLLNETKFIKINKSVIFYFFINLMGQVARFFLLNILLVIFSTGLHIKTQESHLLIASPDTHDLLFIPLIVEGAVVAG
jgi:hypothetical protein